MLAHLKTVAHSRRSACLELLGVTYVLIAISMIGLEDQIRASATARLAYAAPLALASMDVWAVLFAVAGVIALGAAVTLRHAAGFVALMGLGSWWAAMFAASWITTGYERSVLGLLQWVAVTLLLAVIVGWPDQPRHLKLPRNFEREGQRR